MARKKTVATGKGKRRSKAEADTGAKANAVEVRTAKGGIGDNSGDLGLPVVIESKDFHYHLKAYKAAIEKKDTAVSLVRGVLKGAAQLHKELPGALKEAVTVERDNDPFRLKQRLEVLGIALKETGSPIQISVFDTLHGDVAQQSYERGFGDGENGRTLNDRYPVGSDLSAQYVRGWRHGTGKNLGQSPEQVDAALADAEWDAAAPKEDTSTPAEGEGGDAFGLPPADTSEAATLQ